MELLRKTYHLALTYTVTVNDEPILSPKIPEKLRQKDGTETIEDTQQVKRLLVAVLDGKKSILNNMIAERIAYQIAGEGDEIFEMITGEDIDVLNNALATDTVESLQEEDKKHFEGYYTGMDLVFKLDNAFDLELEQVAFGEVQHQHTHTQNSPTEKKRHHKK